MKCQIANNSTFLTMLNIKCSGLHQRSLSYNGTFKFANTQYIIKIVVKNCCQTRS